MDYSTLRVTAKLRDLSQSDLARAAGVSRQAVSGWMTGKKDLRVSNLQKLSRTLGLSIDQLIEPLPVLDEIHVVNKLQTALLWDRLFPELEDFVIALVKGDLRAIARLVEVYGLYSAAATVGSVVWKNFSRYCRFIHPVRRQQLEILWKIHTNPALI
jgi:transcriptional regulator with XRE-family HTH domain